MHAVLTALALLAAPAAMVALARRVRVLGWLGPVMLCYLLGIVAANVPGGIVHGEASRTAMEVSVPLAIPLLLLSVSFPAWLRLARRTVIAFALAIASVLAVSTAVALLLNVPGEESWKVSGMLVGVYTGGTPNMTAIGWALDVSEETFLLLNAVDMLIGAAWFLVLISVARPVLSRVLPPFPAGEGGGQEQPVEEMGILRRPRAWPGLAAALGVAVLCVAVSAGLSLVAVGTIHETIVIIGISTLGIAASFVGPIRRLEGSYELGQYLILVFCVAIGSQAQLSQLVAAGLPFLIYVSLVMFGSIAVHLALMIALRVDVDTAIVTSTAAIYGPAFIGPVAGALGNREIVVSGITAGLVGIALGNYLGLALAAALHALA